MKRSRRLRTVADLAALAEAASRRRLATATQDLLRKEQQQTQLQAYDGEYAERWIETGRAGLGGIAIQRLARFRAGLGESIGLQEQFVDAARRAAAERAAEWAAQRERVRVFEDLVARARRVEEREQERREQRVQDDLSAGRSGRGPLR